MNLLLRKLFVFILLFSTVEAMGQFGLRAKYNLNTFSEWDDYIDQFYSSDVDKIFPSNLELGVDYWFRLKNHRIEFMPEIAMGLKTSSVLPQTNAEASISYFALNFNTQVYLFDLTGDCDCPTFSKQGPSLNKGFFLSITPGLLYNTKEVELESTDPSLSASQVNLRLGIGAGYDIGISDLFTITPSISYNMTPSVNFERLDNAVSPAPITVAGPEAANLKQIQFQIRFGFRPDYVKSYGRGRR
ncbi:MAG: hypothetical protein P1U56_18880 [Saprospiraceae bacterium]|nr:hypothetical protein [Saprospiraceae bacterium]